MVFHDLFLSKDIEYQNYGPDDRELVRNAVHSVITRPGIISVNSPEPLFPWGLLQQRLPELSPWVTIPSWPRILAAADGELYGDGDIPVESESATIFSVTPADEFGKELANFEKDCFYFFGHAWHGNSPTSASSYIKLRAAHLIVDELGRIYKAPLFKGNPVLAFLNGCKTAPLSALSPETVVG